MEKSIVLLQITSAIAKGDTTCKVAILRGASPMVTSSRRTGICAASYTIRLELNVEGSFREIMHTLLRCSSDFVESKLR